MAFLLSETMFMLQDCLVKQGMYTQYAETLLKNVAKAVNNLKYDTEVAKNCITAFRPQVQKSGELLGASY
jgi:E3 ubiquitin-protein ligase UBR4